MISTYAKDFAWKKWAQFGRFRKKKRKFPDLPDFWKEELWKLKKIFHYTKNIIFKKNPPKKKKPKFFKILLL
jgi:hypothetical protein